MKLSNQNIYNLRGVQKLFGVVPNASGGWGAHPPPPPRTPRKSVPDKVSERR